MNMRIRIAGIVDESIVDGPGFRMAVFVQGCPHHCPECHNPQTHDFNGGSWMDTAEIIERAADNPLLDGVTLSGGEPFCQPLACVDIARRAREIGLNVWSYSGYTYEALVEMGEEVRALLEQLDVLVDGPYLKDRRTLELRFRGSDNQRLIDVPASLKTGQAVEKLI